MWPEWWDWELAFTGHVELRMEQREVTEVEVRSMLQRASGFSPSVGQGRFMIETTHRGRPWIVIVEPDPDDRVLVIVTAYEYSP
ncbi:MAG: DUF4258 domain-containing protein [Candidatus Rokubacteria bacterium]|nr:DUF4258 domain-containing protein [Candidatus Rokubacteria bacterium]